METINQRFNISRIFTYVGLAALFGASIFKVLHLNGTSELGVLSFFALTISLVSGSIAGVYFNRDKGGALNVLGLVAGIVLMIAGYTFKILHLAGADQIIMLAALTSTVFMFVNTFNVYNRAEGSSSLFSFLHEKYTPGIERFLLLLIIPVLVSKMVNIVLVYAAGLQFTALMWRYMDQNSSYRNPANLILIIIAFVCPMIAMLGPLVPMSLRLTAVVLFSFVGAFLALRFDDRNRISSWLVCIAPIMFTLTSLVKIGWMTSFADNLPLNILICAVIVAGVFSSPKHSVMRTFMLLALGYLLEL